MMKHIVCLTGLLMGFGLVRAQQGEPEVVPRPALTANVIYFDINLPTEKVDSLLRRFDACPMPDTKPIACAMMMEKQAWKGAFLFSNGQQPLRTLTEEDIQTMLRECSGKY